MIVVPWSSNGVRRVGTAHQKGADYDGAAPAAEFELRPESLKHAGGAIMQRNRQGWPRLGSPLLLLGGVALLPSVAGLPVTIVPSVAPSATAISQPTRFAEAREDQGTRPPPNAAAQHKLIVQPRESIPPPDREPDCIFLPCPPKVIEAMLKLADVRPGEVLFDLGSGDGCICIAAAKQYRARAYGYEIQAKLVEESVENVKKNKLQDLVTIERRDIFKLDLSGADVVTLWLLPALNVKLIPQLEKMKPGSRIVSVDFDMCDIVKPDKVIEVPEQRYDNASVFPFWSSTRMDVWKIHLWKTPLKKDEKLFRESYPKLFRELESKQESKQGRT
jgi:hypothetical protein